MASGEADNADTHFDLMAKHLPLKAESFVQAARISENIDLIKKGLSAIGGREISG